MVFFVKNGWKRAQMLKFSVFHRIYVLIVVLYGNVLHLSSPKSYQLNLIWKK